MHGINCHCTRYFQISFLSTLSHQSYTRRSSCTGQLKQHRCHGYQQYFPVIGQGYLPQGLEEEEKMSEQNYQLKSYAGYQNQNAQTNRRLVWLDKFSIRTRNIIICHLINNTSFKSKITIRERQNCNITGDVGAPRQEHRIIINTKGNSNYALRTKEINLSQN